MKNKKMLTCIRRRMICAALVVCVACTAGASRIIPYILFDGFGRLPQALVLLAIAGAMALFADWMCWVDDEWKKKGTRKNRER